MKRFMLGAAAVALIGGVALAAPTAQAVPQTAIAQTAVAKAAAAKAAAATQVSYAPPPITWGACADAGLKAAKAQCGRLVVPLDYAKPKGTKIRLAVSRVAHTSTAVKYQGIMLVNPGGPGGSGLTLSTLGSAVPNDAGDAYDWIGFDPRGVGSSIPSLTCNGDYFAYDRPTYVPTTKKLETTWLAKAKGYSAACKKAAGAELLNHVKTTDTVYDMDSLRKALGRSQINYYGFSYGSYLGQVYSTLFPARVRRMVLDGVVDPSRVWYAANLDQDVAFNRNIKIYFGWIAKYDSVYHLGKTEAAVEKLFYSTQTKLDKKPAGGKIGGDEWTDIFLQAGYYVFGWEDVANAFAGYIHDGDWQTLKSMYDDTQPQGKDADNGYAMYLATQCTDVQWPKSWAKWKADNNAINKKAPFETWSNAWYNAPCLTWPGKAGKPVSINGAKSPAILLISETLDAATPYSGALKVRGLYPKSVLIEGVGGTTHAGSLFGISCTDDTIATYLTSGALPARVAGNKSDKQCPPNPQPDPTEAAAGSQQAASAGSVRGVPAALMAKSA
jgi:pimeloyl-ACP methyl ester carboxylesterase